jgi:hypothetical protein
VTTYSIVKCLWRLYDGSGLCKYRIWLVKIEIHTTVLMIQVVQDIVPCWLTNNKHTGGIALLWIVGICLLTQCNIPEDWFPRNHNFDGGAKLGPSIFQTSVRPASWMLCTWIQNRGHHTSSYSFALLQLKALSHRMYCNVMYSWTVFSVYCKWCNSPLQVLYIIAGQPATVKVLMYNNLVCKSIHEINCIILLIEKALDSCDFSEWYVLKIEHSDYVGIG